MDDETERDLKDKCERGDLSPVEMLQLLDDTVENILQDHLKLDYFALFDKCLAVLRAATRALGPKIEARVFRGGVQKEPHCFEKLPLHIVEELKARGSTPEEEKRIFDVLVEVFREHLGSC